MDIIAVMIKMVSAFAIVLGLMALSAYGARRFFGARIGRTGKGPFMRVQSSISLGVKKEIALVEVGNQLIVVGVTPGQISFLTRIKKEETISDFRPEEKGIAEP